MKRIKLLIILISGFVFSQEAMFNIGSEKNERFSTTLKMNDGSLFVFGQRGNCEGALSPCNGVSQEDNIDPVIYKFNSNLELEWSKEYQREYVDYFLSATVYNNHIYITGSTKTNFNEPTTYDTDFLLLKVDLDGNVVWSKRLGGPCNGAETYCGDVAKKIIINNDIIFVSGIYAFYGTALYDAVILKLNLDGDLIEESVINSGNGSNFFFDAVKTPTGNMLYTGRSKNGGWEPWLYYLDQQNNVLFSNTYGDQSTNADDGFKTIYHNQNFYMLTTYSGQYVNLNKIDLNGNLVWSKKFEGTNARDLLVYNNEIYIAVRNNYQNTLGIIKINTNGNLIQQKQFSYMGGGGYPVKMEIINDQLVIAGTVEYVSNGYDDIYLMTIDPFLNEGPLCLEDNDWGSFYIEENNNVFQAPIGYSEYNITQINNVDLTQNPIVQNLLSNSCGCSDTNACNYNPEATISIDVCEYESCTGCTDPEACNYNQGAVEDNGACEYIELGLGEDIVTCEDFVVLDAGEGYGSYLWSTGEDSQTINVSESGNYNVDVVNTLSDPIIETQCGYQSAGFINPDSGILSDEGWMYRDILISENESVYSIFADFYRPGEAESDHDLMIHFYENCDNIFDCENYTFYSLFNYQSVDSSLYQTELLVSDFIDSGSTFFNMGFQTAGSGVLRILAPLVSIEDQWSDLCVTLLTNPTCSNSDNINVTFNICGCVDETACNYNPNAVVAENVCDYESCSGCIDDTACNYDPEATIGANICDYESCSGCIDDTACNYDPEATIGANICDYSCYGCVDPIACNYNSNSTFDDGSCEYIEDVNLGDDVNTCETSFTLNAGAGYGTYSWSTGETTQTIEVSDSGNYNVQVSNGAQNNNSIIFDGLNSNFLATNNNIYNNNEIISGTLSLQVKIEDLVNNQQFFSLEGWLEVGYRSELSCIDEPGVFAVSDGSAVCQGSGVFYPLSQIENTDDWINISIIWGEETIELIINGVTVDNNNPISTPLVDNNDRPLTFGVHSSFSSPNSSYYTGLIDNIQIWSNNLSYSQINEYINCPPFGNEDGLIGYWNFNNGLNEEQAVDLSLNGNNATINGASYIQNTSNNCETCSDSDNINITFNVCGCTDFDADNYNPEANVDDGSCEYLGCTDEGACNYNSLANTDDGTCQLCSSREFNDGAYLDVDSEIINAQGLTISFWVNSDDFCENPSQFSTYIDFGSQETYRYVVRNRSCKIEAFFEGDMLPTDFDWGEMDWDYPKASAAGSLVPNGEQAGWRQVTTVFCPTTIRIYIDGEIVASNGTGVYFQEGFNLFEEDIKRIGSNQINNEPANAIIDEVRVWNRALSGEEVLARSSTTTTLNTTEELNLNGYWKMDCDNPFLNQITNQQGVESLVVGTNFNENFNNNNCETNIEYNYDCSLDFEGNPDCNSCDPPEGCTDEEACNYDYLAITPINDACFYVPDYCPNLDYPEYYDCDCKCINDVDVDDVCDELEVDGCSEDESACNYNPEGTQPCIFAIDQYPSGLYDCEGICYNDNDPPTNNEGGLGDGVCDEIDNCPETYNPNQVDINADGIGDDCDGVGLYENSTTKKLIKIVDVLGREIKENANKKILIYIYDNGEIIPSYNF